MKYCTLWDYCISFTLPSSEYYVNNFDSYNIQKYIQRESLTSMECSIFDMFENLLELIREKVEKVFLPSTVIYQILSSSHNWKDIEKNSNWEIFFGRKYHYYSSRYRISENRLHIFSHNADNFNLDEEWIFWKISKNSFLFIYTFMKYLETTPNMQNFFNCSNLFAGIENQIKIKSNICLFPNE